MKYEEISPAMRGFIGMHEGFRKLGFESKDIFCVIARSARNAGVLSCFAVLKQGEFEFSAEVGPITNADAFEREHVLVTESIVSGKVPEEVLDRIWQESVPFNNGLAFVLAIKNKGIELPNKE